VPAVGTVEINRTRIDAHDGVAIRDVPAFMVTALDDAEIVLIDSR